MSATADNRPRAGARPWTTNQLTGAFALVITPLSAIFPVSGVKYLVQVFILTWFARLGVKFGTRFTANVLKEVDTSGAGSNVFTFILSLDVFTAAVITSYIGLVMVYLVATVIRGSVPHLGFWLLILEGILTWCATAYLGHQIVWKKRPR